jgi:membrane-associated phospholipid phosphatase
MVLVAVSMGVAGARAAMREGTWVIGPPQAWRQAPTAVTDEDTDELLAIVGRRDVTTDDVIRYWDTGPPSYRWNEIALGEIERNGEYTPVAARSLALVHVAMYDALAAAWDTKSAHPRQRPSARDARIVPIVAVPTTPSYPAEHAVAAGAASAVLAYLYPDRAAMHAQRAEEAARSRVLAGVNYASDVDAGLALGRAVAARVIERARGDGSDRPWTGAIPTEPGKWTGSNPALPQVATWRPWVLATPGELRPGPPPSPDSGQLTQEMDELRRFPRTPKTDTAALFWEHAAGGARAYRFWNELIGRKLLEERLDHDAPLAARVYAVTQVAFYDTAVACWDAKYAYWAIRPAQLDPSFKPLFATPNHPSYPSGHSCFSSAAATALAHFFPRDAASFEALALEASESRLWAGIHYRSDLTAGGALGRAVAQRVIAHMESASSR